MSTERYGLNKELAQMLKGGVIMDVTTPEQAKIAEAAGACAVMALERIPADIRAAGGVSRMSDPKMTEGIQNAVSIPVIAAGGIADGRGMAAAFMLGAEGVQMGTRFVAARESIVHENYKQKIIRAKDIDSTITGASTGHPVRCLRNQMTREYQEMEKQGVDFMELEKLTLRSLRRAVIDGDTAGGTLMAGQIAGLVRSQDSCKEIINEIMEQADRLLGR